MNIGNELHSGLSSLSKQSYLLLTEVPEMIIVFNINYQLQYSPCYTGTIHGTCEVHYFNYCMSFANAMQALLRQNFNSFLLKILSTKLVFYCNGDGKFKIFGSHGRDSYGMPHLQGTCELLEVNTLNELINYFDGLYQNPNVLFELKGVHINEKQCDMTDISDSCQLSPSKQIMQMLKLQPFIFPCYAVVPHLFIAFVFPLSNIVGIGIHRL